MTIIGQIVFIQKHRFLNKIHNKNFIICGFYQKTLLNLLSLSYCFVKFLIFLKQMFFFCFLDWIDCAYQNYIAIFKYHSHNLTFNCQTERRELKYSTMAEAMEIDADLASR